MQHILTFDVEDWYHLSGQQIRGAGTLQPAILERQVDRLLALLVKHDTHATFFCLGSSLEGMPHLVRRIADAGHAVGSHGWGHQLIKEIGLPAFREDLRRSLDWLADLLGTPARGYRAPAFSVAPAQVEGFFEVCAEAGLDYDSSVFPIQGRRYGVPTAPVEPYAVQVNGRRLIELPLSTLEHQGKRQAVAGGGHWRVRSVGQIKRALAELEAQGRPMVTYMHPYEFDDRPLSTFQAAGVSLKAAMHHARQNLFRGSMYRKLDAVLAEFRFGTAEEYIRDAAL